MTKIPCGGFYFDDSAFELTKQGEKKFRLLAAVLLLMAVMNLL